MKSIINLNNDLNDFEWGYKIDNKNVVEVDDFKNYKLLSPQKFLEDKCGTCWDYVNFEATFFKHILNFKNSFNLNKNEFSCFYAEVENESNHTWIAYKTDSIYVFESSWKDFKGIYKFNNKQDMVCAWSNLLRFTEHAKHVTTYEYLHFDSGDMLPEEFMKKARVRKIYEV